MVLRVWRGLTLRRRIVIVALLALLAGVAVWTVSANPAHGGIDTARLGARYSADGSTITFRVHSGTATRIAVYLYDQSTGAAPVREAVLAKSGSIWEATVPAAGQYYGYRAWGPNWPYSASWTPGSAAGVVSDVDAGGNRFNPNKLLLDPYAREVSHDPLRPGMTDETVYTSGPAKRTVDSGPNAAKGVLLTTSAPATGTKPSRPLKDDIVYEAHLRGLTAGDTSIPAAYRGTYRGAGMKAAQLAALGVTAVEFLPVQETQNDANDVDATGTAGDNYWGYMTLNYFAPDRRYSSDKSPGGPTAEFAAMVKAFHDNGLKVFIDVVYNHTGEGGVHGGDKNVYNLFSYRGLDNPTYYSLSADRQSSVDNTGVGGNYNTYNPTAQNLIVDSLAHWRDTLGVDGFRHDLASVLGNTCQHACFSYSRTDPATALNRITAEMPPRPAAGGSGTDWIAEPWALGDGTYQVGNFPAGWSEWNGRYRDTLRSDQNKLGVDAVTPGQLAGRFAGSADLYGDDGRKPWNSVNFMVAHDGFTLKDLYSCNAKNNTQAWPYGPSDGGSDDNISWDHGGTAALQRKAARNGTAFLMLSAGTPMMTAGDEYLRSVRCNNNPYNLDSSANWLSSSFDSTQTDFRTFTTRLAEFRKAHPALRPADFYTSADGDGDGLKQLDWFTPNGAAPDASYWDGAGNHALGWRYDGSELGDSASAIFVGYNGWSGDVSFTLPSPGAGKQWYRVTDTGSWAEGPNQVATPGGETLIGGAGTEYLVRERGLLLLIAK